MHTTIYEHDNYDIKTTDTTYAGQRRRAIELIHPLREWTFTIALNEQQAAELMAALHKLFVDAAPFVPEPERDAAPTEGGVVATQAQRDADYEAFATAAVTLAACGLPARPVEQAIADYNAKAVDFIASKLGMTL